MLSSTGQPSCCLTVCVIADHWLSAEYLAKMLISDGAITLVTFSEILEVRDGKRAQVFVIDYCGLQVPFSQCMIVLRQKFSGARYIVVGPEGTQEEVMRIVQMGADGFIPYPHVAGVLLRAVHAVAAGQLWLDSHTLRLLLRTKGVAVSYSRHRVTLRESQILELAKDRLSNKEIAAALGIQESTVKYHLTNIFTKLGVNSRDDLRENPRPKALWNKLLAT
jgi:DNA-binding NarL/FixJ family response regulator